MKKIALTMTSLFLFGSLTQAQSLEDCTTIQDTFSTDSIELSIEDYYRAKIVSLRTSEGEFLLHHYNDVDSSFTNHQVGLKKESVSVYPLTEKLYALFNIGAAKIENKFLELGGAGYRTTEDFRAEEMYSCNEFTSFCKGGAKSMLKELNKITISSENSMIVSCSKALVADVLNFN